MEIAGAHGHHGEGLGSSNTGISAPIMAGEVKKYHLGVGAHAPGEVTPDADIYEQYKKQMMLGYRHRPNPLLILCVHLLSYSVLDMSSNWLEFKFYLIKEHYLQWSRIIRGFSTVVLLFHVLFNFPEDGLLWTQGLNIPQKEGFSFAHCTTCNV